MFKGLGPQVINTPWRANLDLAKKLGIVAWYSAAALPRALTCPNLIGQYGPIVYVDPADGRSAEWHFNPKHGPEFRLTDSQNQLFHQGFSGVPFTTRPLSLFTWVRTHSSATLGSYFSMNDGAGDSANGRCWLGANPGNNAVWRVSNYTAQAGFSMGQSSIRFLAGTATYDSTIYLYVDGIEAATSSGTTGPSNVTGISILDGQYSGEGGFFEGGICNRQLTAAEILYLYKNRWDMYEPILQRSFSIPISGGGAYYQSVSGAISPTGSITSSIGKLLSGAVSPIGSILKSISINLVGSITPSGSKTSKTGKGLSGSISPVGENTYQAQKSVSGSVAPSGSITRNIFISLAGAITPIGSLLKKVGTNLAGAITPSGGLSARIVIQQLVQGVIAPIGSLVSKPKKVLSGLITPIGEITKQVSKSFSGSITPTSILTAVKTFYQTVAGSIAPSGDLAKKIKVNLQGAVAPLGVIIRSIKINLSGSITPTGIVSGAIETVTAAYNIIMTAIYNLLSSFEATYVYEIELSAIYSREIVFEGRMP